MPIPPALVIPAPGFLCRGDEVGGVELQFQRFHVAEVLQVKPGNDGGGHGGKSGGEEGVHAFSAAPLWGVEVQLECASPVGKVAHQCRWYIE